MHWTYEEERDSSNLCQGDVLARTPDLLDVIGRVHHHFTDAKYKAFMVVTQSCDLFRRQGRCKAPYLTIAVVRSVEDALRHEMAGIEAGKPGTLCNQAFVSDRLRDRLQQTCESFFNNNLDGYFFLRADADANVEGDLCAFLRVTVPLRVSHYDVLLGAKRTQLKSVFQAKVGWLLGSHYARVATPDWDQSEEDRKKRTELVRVFLHDAHEWLPDSQFRTIRRRVEEGSVQETEEAIGALAKHSSTKPKTRRALVLDAVEKAWPSPDPLKLTFLGRFQRSPEFAEAVSEQKRALVLDAVEKAWPSPEALKLKFLGRFQQLQEFAEAVSEQKR